MAGPYDFFAAVEFGPDHLLLGGVGVRELLLEAAQNRHSLLALGRREDHRDHVRQAFAREEHVLGAAQADPLRAEGERRLRVLRDVRVGADAEPLHVVGPRKQLRELLIDRRLLGLERAVHDLQHLGGRRGEGLEHHLAGRAVDGDDLAFADHPVAHRHGLVLGVDRQRRAADHRGLAHLTADHGRVRRHAAGRGEDALRHVHAVDVVGNRLHADEDHALALVRPGHRVVGGEDHGAGRRTRRGGKTLRRHLGLRAFLRLEDRVQKLIERLGLDLEERLLLGENPLFDEIDRDHDRREAGALAVSRLEHEELVLFDRELEVLDVLVVALEARGDLAKLLVRRGHELLEVGDGVRRADAGHHVLALRVLQELAVELASRRSRDSG